MNTIHGVYKITNKINNKLYIGSAAGKRGIIDRWYQHRSALKNNRHTNQLLQYAFNKYGIDNFIYEIIETCEPIKCLEREQYYLDVHKSYDRNIGYNLCHKAGNTLGRKHSEQTKIKIAKNRIYKSPANKGKKVSEIGRQVMSDAQKKSSKCRENLRILNKSKRKPVIGINIKTGEVIKLEYAGADSRFIDSGIVASCKGRFTSYKGYKWSYDS